MKKAKALICVFIAAVMLVSAIPVMAAESAKNPFGDISENDYYYDAVIWAYEEGITTGTTATRFSPDSTCTRGQVVTFLWRAMGEPEAQATELPFTDVKVSDYYYKAVLWAIENGITNGTGGTLFSPDVTCTNAHILTFIWRAVGEPGMTGHGEWYADSVRWATEGGLIDGTYTGEFDPAVECPRANVVTYLYRYLESGIVTLYVSPDMGSDETGDGTAEAPFRTLIAARNAVRELDKSQYTAIKVRLLPGRYPAYESIDFLPIDSGSNSCNIYYIGEEGAVISGAVEFTAADFTSAFGETMRYFPEKVRDRLVMIDLKQFGFTPSEVQSMIEVTQGGGRAPLSFNGSQLTVARYPNEGYVTVLEGSTVDNAEDSEHVITTATIRFGEEYTEHVKTWHDLSSVYTHARYSSLSVADNSNVIAVNEHDNSMTVPYSGDDAPGAGMIFYWYNIPEELDSPGEYYIDSDCVLYLCPTVDFENGTFSMPLMRDSIIEFHGTKYISLSGLTIESTRQCAIIGDSSNITIKNCTIRSCSYDGISLTGDSIFVTGNEIYSIGNTAVRLMGGNTANLVSSYGIVYDNYIHDWSNGIGVGNNAVYVGGCGTTVSHNVFSDSPDSAVSYSGPHHLIEYNLCTDCCKLSGSRGVIYSNSPWAYGTTVRYNYVKDSGYTRNTAAYETGVHGICADEGQSGLVVYGNVIENMTGSGIDLCGGRDHIIYGNLMIKCRYGISYNSSYYSAIKRGGGGNRVPYPGYSDNKYWTGAFPVLAKMTFDDGANFSDVIADKYFNAAPSSTIENNVYYLDREVADRSLNVYNIDDYVFDFSRIDVPTAEDGTLCLYSSSEKTFDIKEIVRDNEKALAVNVEQFSIIGRISD